MLLTTLQCTGQPPTMKNYLVQTVSSDEAEKHCSKGLHCQYKSNLEIRPFSPIPQNASKIVFLNRGTP